MDFWFAKNVRVPLLHIIHFRFDRGPTANPPTPTANTKYKYNTTNVTNATTATAPTRETNNVLIIIFSFSAAQRKGNPDLKIIRFNSIKSVYMELGNANFILNSKSARGINRVATFGFRIESNIRVRPAAVS